MQVPIPTLRLILGDQLNAKHSWFASIEAHVLYLIAELPQEATYVTHHVQKVQAFFLAMAHFGQGLSDRGHRVCHLTLDETGQFDDLESLVKHVMKEHGLEKFEYQRPDEYRLRVQLRAMSEALGCPSDGVETEHFLLSEAEVLAFFADGKSRRMEQFYRSMRKKTGILMAGGHPVGERWNFDQENRKKLPKAWSPPESLLFENDTTKVDERLVRHGIQTWGTAQAHLVWPVTVAQAEALVQDFVARLLPLFGRYQDAMTDRDWALYHARISFALNCKLMTPQWLIGEVLKAYERDPSTYELASVEGFIRQVMGWREYVRGIYLSQMPEYGQANALANDRPLPAFYWTGKTQMRCVAQVVKQTKAYAYAHHIQRLMVTGNLALLLGVAPDAVDEWYLSVFIDAIEWVEMPNTRGMSQYADGGFLASKPYVSSGKYIQRMSDYCQGCAYNIDERSSEDACPFNSLYWAFLHRHQSTLGNNQRMAMMYSNLKRIPAAELTDILNRADAVRRDPDAF